MKIINLENNEFITSIAIQQVDDIKVINLAPRGGGGGTYQNKTADSSTVSQQITPDAGYNAMTKVTINPYTLQSKSVTLTSETQTITPDASYNGLSSVEVPAVALQQKTITPTTSEQTVNPPAGKVGFSRVIVHGVTSSIDSNIVAGNIKKDVSILGVTGTLEQEVTIRSYTPVKYISNELASGYTTQPYFNLNYTPTENTSVEMIVSAQPSNPFATVVTRNNMGKWFGTQNGNSTFVLGGSGSFGGESFDTVLESNQKIVFLWGSTYYYDKPDWRAQFRTSIIGFGQQFSPMKLTFGKNYTKVNDNQINWDQSATFGSSVGKLFVFGASNQNDTLISQAPCPMRFYDIKIYESGTEVRHYIPALHNNHGEFYEIHTGTYISSGNEYYAAYGPIGEFTLGENEPNYHPYELYYNTADSSALDSSLIAAQFTGILDASINIVSNTYSLDNIDATNGFMGKIVFDKQPHTLRRAFNADPYYEPEQYVGCPFNMATELDLPSEIRIIRGGVFMSWESLTSIKLPNSLSLCEFGYPFGNYVNTFAKCRGLKHVNLSPNMWVAGSDNDLMFEWTSISNIVIPFGVNSVGFRDKSGGPAVQWIGPMIFPSSITKLPRWTTNGAGNPTAIIFKSSIPCNIEGNTFGGYDGNIYVPDDAVSIYQAATNWSNYSAQIKGVSEL